MKESNMYLLNKLFEGKDIRMFWNKDEEKYYISVVDVVGIGNSQLKTFCAEVGIVTCWHTCSINGCNFGCRSNHIHSLANKVVKDYVQSVPEHTQIKSDVE